MKTEELIKDKTYMYDNSLVIYTGEVFNDDFGIKMFAFDFVNKGFGLEITKKRIESGAISNC